MSYNRGMRRDTGRRSNEFGGGGGNRRGGGGNYMNNYDNYNSSMNPWEGGMVPGRSGNSTLGNQGQGDLQSQLTSKEAQLALASNLITKLISQQQQAVPSLLNLGNMGSGGGTSSFNDNYGNNRNFQDRRRRMDQRRTEPYNKPGMNRRMDNDRRNLGRNRMGYERNTPVATLLKAQKEEKDKEAQKTNGYVKTESTDVSKREEKKEEENESSKSKEVEKESKNIPIPTALLHCHVCSKNMWDEISFTKHLKGRPHQLMMDGLNEKYMLKGNLLRHEMRLAEQQREMELERKQRQGLKIYSHPREYCVMCDLHFYGNLFSHRKNNVRHQKLKAFLHPKCSHCNEEFSSRLEWDEHRLLFSHLQKVAEFRRATKPDIKDDDFDIDELVNPDSVNCGEMANKEIPVLVCSYSEEDISEELKEEPLKEKDDYKKEGKEGDNKKEGEKENEMAQGIDIEPNKLPKYMPSVPVGKDLVVEVTGYMCRVCNRFIQSEEECNVHCRTLSHYNNYCNTVRTKACIMGRKKRNDDLSSSFSSNVKEEEQDEETPLVIKKEVGDSVVAEKDNAGKDDEGNWKRRKVNEKDESMEVDDSKQDESKDDIEDSVWEEVDKEQKICFIKRFKMWKKLIEDTDEVYTEDQKETEEDVTEEVNSTPPKPRRGRGVARGGRRGGRRGK